MESLLTGTHRIGVSSDIYAIGVMLFEFATKRLPYPIPPTFAPTDLEHAMNARRVSPQWMKEDVVSSSLRSIIEHCLQFDTRDRYLCAEDLQEDLERESRGESLRFANEPFSSRLQKWVRRNSSLVSASSIATILVALVIPLGLAALEFKHRADRITALNRAESFQERSTEVLTSVFVDPERREERGIVEATKPLY